MNNLPSIQVKTLGQEDFGAIDFEDSFLYGNDQQEASQKNFPPYLMKNQIIQDLFFTPDCRLCPNSAALPNVICGVGGGIICPSSFFCDLRPTSKNVLEDRYGCCCPYPTAPPGFVTSNISTTLSTATAVTLSPTSAINSIVTIQTFEMPTIPCNNPETMVAGCDPCSNVVQCLDGATSVICNPRNCNYVCEGVFTNMDTLDFTTCIQFMFMG
ncbi:unnamed protein product [Gordionus sp. m RMFG-2023]